MTNRKYTALKQYALRANLKTNEDTPSGCSGSYLKLPNGVGVKVYHAEFFNDYRKVFKCETWWHAAHAIHALRLVEKTGVAPKPYCIAPVKVDGKYCVGLFMEHIEGRGSHPAKKAAAAYRKLEKCGVYHSDRGGHNAILMKNGILKIIDFDGVGINK